MRDCCNGIFQFETQIVLFHFLLFIASPLNKIQIKKFSYLVTAPENILSIILLDEAKCK